MKYLFPYPVGRACNGSNFSGKTGKKKMGWFNLLKERNV
jgi:hypothetical protein